MYDTSSCIGLAHLKEGNKSWCSKVRCLQNLFERGESCEGIVVGVSLWNSTNVSMAEISGKDILRAAFVTHSWMNSASL